MKMGLSLKWKISSIPKDRQVENFVLNQDSSLWWFSLFVFFVCLFMFPGESILLLPCLHIFSLLIQHLSGRTDIPWRKNRASWIIKDLFPKCNEGEKQNRTLFLWKLQKWLRRISEKTIEQRKQLSLNWSDSFPFWG